MEEILHQAERLEKDYDWFGAAELYEKILNLVPKDDFLKMGQIHERLGNAFFHFAFQTESSSDFRKRMPQSVEKYGKAKEFYGQIHEPAKTARMLRCDAMIAFAGFWLASQASEKKRLLDDCWRLTKEALKGLDDTGSALEYGETYNQLSSSADDRYGFESSFQFREELIKEAVQYGERAIILLSSVSSPHELARAYVKTAMYLSVFGWYFASDMDEKDGYYMKGLGYWQKAVELSEETAFLELLSMSGEGLGWKADEMRVQYGKALNFARKTKDKYVIGTALDWLTYATAHVAINLDEGPRARAHFEKALEYAEDTMHQFSPISYVSPRGAFFWTGVPYAEYYNRLAFWETNLSRKRDLLKKAIDYGATAVKQADSAGYPDIMMHARYVRGGSLVSLAKIETNSGEKRTLLESAVEHMKEEMKLREELERFNYLNLGNMWQKLASLKAELSQLETDDEKRKNVLEAAISYQEQGLQLCMKYISHKAKKGNEISGSGFVGWGQYVYGEMLARLYGLTHNSELQRKALRAFTDSAEAFQKLNLASRVAESYWRVARGYDALGEHLKAAENFNLASDNYRRAAEKIPQLKDFYHGHAGYMQAWTEIEAARDHHERQEYDLAREHFEKAANVHKLLIHWSYLAPNYFAWTRLEEAEELSRKEQSEEAIQAFEQAVRLFNETKKSLQTQLDKIENLEEKQMAIGMVKATDERREYCIGRIALEEAKILDKQGDHYSSSEKYSSAAETFEKLSQALDSEQDKKELKFTSTLSRAWQKMTRAEAEASPALYFEASKLFEEAKESGPSERIKMLTLGHSRFCRALEAGTRFTDTRDATLHDAVIQHLGSAADYYVKAGFQNTSEYAKATKLLFDAYVHIGNAERQTDPEKKAKLYTMAEKILQASAGSFMKAEHPEKREQVLKLLEKVKEERELAISLSEVLHAPTIVSATTTFSTPTPTRESAVGLERFEHADIQANVIISQKELKIGESLHLRVELINAGKYPAFLTRISDVVPESFDLVEEPEMYSVEDRGLNMKGKQLKPLKAEEISIVVRPLNKGTFMVKPRVMYLDESGHQMSSEPKPDTIDVSEVHLPSRVSTGFGDLDNLLLGGLPENRVILMTSPSCDERDMLIRSFLQTGAKKGEATFYLTIDVSGIRGLVEEYQSDFYVFVCNPKADQTIENLPNVFKLRGVENLTEISIALTSAFRKLDPNVARRACIVIISDVLLLHGAPSARRWLAALIPELRSNRFTTLAVMNPKMHPPEVTQAILDLFDGEIDIYEKETKRRTEKMLKIKRLYDQKYLDTELPLRKERLVG